MIAGPAIAVSMACLILALVCSAVLTAGVRRVAVRIGFVDHPADETSHKTHRRAVPFGGGIAISVAILLPVTGALVAAYLLTGVSGEAWPALTARMPNWPHWLGGVRAKMPQAVAVIGGAIVLHAMGLIDDRRPLSARTKLIVQLAVAFVLAGAAGIRAGEAMGELPATLLTVLWIVTLTNAFNFMDNMDGLSAGVAGMTAIVLALAALTAGQVFVPCLCALVAGAVLGFLLFNFPPASIFMGDAGSLVIGYMLAVCAVLTTFYDPDAGRRPFGVLVPLVVFAIPLYDLTSVIVYRLRQGVSIFRGDRRHFSHRLVRLGLSPRHAVLTIYLATVATALPAVILPLHGWAVAVLISAQCLSVVAIIAILETRDGS